MTNNHRNRQWDYSNSTRLRLRPNVQRDPAINVSVTESVQNGTTFGGKMMRAWTRAHESLQGRIKVRRQHNSQVPIVLQMSTMTPTPCTLGIHLR